VRNATVYGEHLTQIGERIVAPTGEIGLFDGAIDLQAHAQFRQGGRPDLVAVGEGHWLGQEGSELPFQRGSGHSGRQLANGYTTNADVGIDFTSIAPVKRHEGPGDGKGTDE